MSTLWEFEDCEPFKSVFILSRPKLIGVKIWLKSLFRHLNETELQTD